MSRRFLALALTAPIFVAACSNTRDTNGKGFHIASYHAVRAEPLLLMTPTSVGTYGKTCKYHGTDAAGLPIRKFGPVSYDIRDAGKYGVPKLSNAQGRLLMRIRQYIHDGTVRFAFVHNFGYLFRDGFVVFDARGDSVCSPNTYWILNQPPLSNLYYQPSNDPAEQIFPMMAPVPTAGPWMRPR